MKKLKNVVPLIVATGVFTGCSSGTADPKISMKPPVYVEQLPSRQTTTVQANSGSLFNRGDNPLFSDVKAMNVNDIVTVIINEAATQNSAGTKAITETNANNFGGGVFGTNSSVEAMQNTRDALNKVTDISFNASSSNNYTGNGTATRNENFTTTISARVIKIMNNGNYFIEGSRELLLNGEKQIMQISGVIRPIDIDNTNSINSAQIADAKILYKTEGEIERATKQPWGSKMIEAIWPF